jgi:hypothetical protein
MKTSALLLSLPVLVCPLQAAKWPEIPKEVWAMRTDPALVAKGAIILERKLDFQPAWIDCTLRVRILGASGLAAAELRDLPVKLLSLDGQITLPDGKVLPIGKREGFQVRKRLAAEDGATPQEVLVVPGVTTDCVLDLAWREQTTYGQSVQVRKLTQGQGYLPQRCGPFWFWDLGAAYPTKKVVVQRAKDFYWSLTFNTAGPAELEEGATSMGETFTFRDLPAYPPAPFAPDRFHPSPKAVIYRPVASVTYLQYGVPANEYWDKVADLFYKGWYLKFLTKGEAYKAWSLALRQDLKGGPREKARLIAERLLQRTVNLDQLLYGEKPGMLARYGVDEGKLALGNARFYDPADSFNVGAIAMSTGGPGGGDTTVRYSMEDDRVSSMNTMAKSGFVDNKGITRLLFHLLADEGIPVKVGLVADRRKWIADPELRTPFQFTNNLLAVEEPGQPILWLDPTNRMLPPGEVAPEYQATKAVFIDAATWTTGVRDIAVAAATANTRTFTFQVDATQAEAKVHVDAVLTGASAFLARNVLGPLAPPQREAWFKTALEQGGLKVARLEVAEAVNLAKPLVCAADGAVALAPGATLTLNPFPGLTSDLYLPETEPVERVDPILLPYLGLQEAVSTVKVPKGYLLREPVVTTDETTWGTVALEVRQDPASGDLKARMKVSTLVNQKDGGHYPSLQAYLKLVRSAISPRITLEKAP